MEDVLNNLDILWNALVPMFLGLGYVASGILMFLGIIIWRKKDQMPNAFFYSVTCMFAAGVLASGLLFADDVSQTLVGEDVRRILSYDPPPNAGVPEIYKKAIVGVFNFLYIFGLGMYLLAITSMPGRVKSNEGLMMPIITIAFATASMQMVPVLNLLLKLLPADSYATYSSYLPT